MSEPPHGRDARVARLLERVAGWAAGEADVRAVALVGSHARGEARADSDVDLMILTEDPQGRLVDLGWVAAAIGEAAGPIRSADWGAIQERRFVLPDGCEVELGLGAPSWAAAEPVEPGTRRVVAGGLRPVFDPEGMLAALVAACRGGAERR
jgi:predicted nucleotidyltransferase